MFLISKLLPLLVLPLGLSFALLLLGLLRRRRWPVITALSVLWVFSTPLTAQALWRWLEWPWQPLRPASLPRADVIVVLGGGRQAAPGSLRRSEWIDADRFFGGLDLLRSGRAPRLLFTGGRLSFQAGVPSEGETLRQQAIALGVPAARVATTSLVSNTAEEAAAVAALLPAGSRILLVTSAFHMQRARRLFEAQGLGVIPYPVDFQSWGVWAGSPLADPLQWFPSSMGLESSSRALREALGRTLYRAW